ncbi:proline/glycine betaine ABC transporter permease [Nesterenkonia sp. NBAIMH1]|uniref:ABC transporter permease n=1 Tax=Nesterenkonia sp. NBAIMH1 TaxID=2600320 RepID=UPI00143D1DE1|nr:ABC transporter permease subunit [Nesterenkonia sp. NBAIMH1]
MADEAIDFRIPLGDWTETAEDWIQDVFDTPLGLLADLMRMLFDIITDGLASVLPVEVPEWSPLILALLLGLGLGFAAKSWRLGLGTALVLGLILGGLHLPPWYIVAVVFAAIAWLAKSWKLALGTLVGMTLIFGVGLWEEAMDTLALVAVATLVSIVIGVPLGIAAAYSRTFSAGLRPVLDFLQTMPPMVYLIPAIAFFSVGVVPGMVATILFSMAPSARLTELGIRGVNHEVVEAGEAFGASTSRILRQIQLPLAVPTIMAGINQVIMLGLSMVVIAGMVGAGALGGEVVRALSGNDLALGVEAGICVVVLAMFLDRITAHSGRAKT